MHADPRQLVHSREFVLVVRLVLVEDDGHVECIVCLLDHAGRLDLHRSGGGRDVSIRQVIQVREGLRAVGRGRILWWEGGPDVTRVLPLGPHHEIDLRGVADGRPGKGHFGDLVARPTDVTVTGEGVHVGGHVLFVGGGPPACAVRHDRMVGRILEHESVVSRERQHVRETPIGRQGRTAFAGVEVHEEVCTLFRSGEVGALPAEGEVRVVPGQVEADAVGVGAHQGVRRPFTQVTVHVHVVRCGSSDHGEHGR